jgi:hypothetical protein
MLYGYVASAFTSPANTQVVPGTPVSPASSSLLADGRRVSFASPDLVCLYLYEAAWSRDAGEQHRQAVLSDIEPCPYTTTMFGEPGYTVGAAEFRVFDAVAAYSTAVFYAYAAVEAMANEQIANLPPTAETVGSNQTRVGQDMLWFSTSEKLGLVLPQHCGAPNIKGTKPWSDFKSLEKMRNALVHLRHVIGPEEPEFVGKILDGDARLCPEHAVSIINALVAGRISDDFLKAAGIRP